MAVSAGSSVDDPDHLIQGEMENMHESSPRRLQFETSVLLGRHCLPPRVAES